MLFSLTCPQQWTLLTGAGVLGVTWGTLGCTQNLASPEAFSAGQGFVGCEVEGQMP